MAAPMLAPMPGELDVTGPYTLRVTAVSPTDGSLVSGVNVGTMVITASGVAQVTDGGGVSGDAWFLVPGPGA